MKKRISLTVAYDGTQYCGWQIQNNGKTVQGELLFWFFFLPLSVLIVFFFSKPP